MKTIDLDDLAQLEADYKRLRSALTWRDIIKDPPPLGHMVWLWQASWRHAFPGQRNGDFGQCYVDTCETEARGHQSSASHWMPLPVTPDKLEQSKNAA